MHNIWLLLKNYMICGIGNFRRKNTRTKAVVGLSVVTLIALGIWAMFFGSMMAMTKELVPYGLQAGVLVLGLTISIFLSLIFAIQKVTGGQKANDTELLLSMPFKKIEIIVAKTISRFAFNLLVMIMFFLPCIIAYLVYTPFNLVALLGCLVVMLLIPLMAVGLSSLVDFLVTICFSSSKFGNIAKTIMTLIILIGAITIYEFLILNIDNPYAIQLIDWMVTFNPLVMLPLIIGVVLFFVVGCWLNARLLNRETRALQAKPTKISARTTTPFKSLLKNESNRYFNSPTLMINTVIGPLFMLILTGWLVIDKAKTLTTMIVASFGVSQDFSFLLIGLMFASLTILTYPAAFSISLEGKQLWILRSMPIKAHTILNAKVLFNILLVSPIVLLCSIILQITLQLSLLNFIIILLIPILSNVLISYTGVFINLCFPKLEFESDAAVIKQSISSLVMMFGGMIIVAGLIALSIFLINYIPLLLITLIITSILLILIGIVLVLNYTIGQRMFNRL